jgi:hypothetical protein
LDGHQLGHRCPPKGGARLSKCNLDIDRTPGITRISGVLRAASLDTDA